MSIGRSIVGLCIVALGVALFGEQYGWWAVNMARLWPVFLLIPGLAFLTGSSQRRRPGLLIPGVILTVYALTFFVEAWTNYHFTSSLSFIYTFAVALAFFAYAAADDRHRPGLVMTARILTAVSAVVLLSTTSNGRFWPLILILVGLMLIFRPRTMRSAGAGPTAATPGSPVSGHPTVMNEAIHVSYPQAGDPRLDIEFGAGTLRLTRGDEAALVTGTARYTHDAWKPVVATNGQHVRVRMGEESWWSSMGSWMGRWHDQVNEWNLHIGTKPVHLGLRLGALKGRLDIGGLALHDLRIDHGAADLEVDFSQPNTIPMSGVKMTGGAGKFTARHLAAAQAARIEYSGGAGETTLDFSGTLSQDCQVTIRAGVGKVNLIIPTEMSCEITKGGLAAVEIDSSWQRTATGYAQTGTGHHLVISAELGLGALAVRPV